MRNEEDKRKNDRKEKSRGDREGIEENPRRTIRQKK